MKIRFGPYPKNHKKYRVEHIEIDLYDTWNLYHDLAKIIHPLLLTYRDNTCGTPGNLTQKQWDKILDQMIWSFDEIIEDRIFYDPKENEIQQKKNTKRIKFIRKILSMSLELI